MVTTTTIHEKITAKIIKAIEKGQTPPWRKPASLELENTGFPCNIFSHPFTGISVFLLNLAASEKNLASKFWTTQPVWELLGGRVSGDGTLIPSKVDPNRWITVFNGDQVSGDETGRFRSSRRSMPVAVDYSPAEAVIQASQATIHHRFGFEAAYYFPPADYIIFPLKEQFLSGLGGLPGYYDSLLHELAHFSEPRLGWDGPSDIRELRAEIAAPFIASQLGIPVLCEMRRITNHLNHLPRWIKAMKDDPSLIFNVANDASAAAAYLLSLRVSRRF